MLKVRLLETNGPVLDHLGKFGNSTVQKLLIVVRRVRDDVPEIVTHGKLELGCSGSSSKKRDDVEFGHIKLTGGSLSDLGENVFNVGLIE